MEQQAQRKHSEQDEEYDTKNSSSTPGVNNEIRNQILEEHTKNFPEGDPSVRRISPDKGTFGAGPMKLTNH